MNCVHSVTEGGLAVMKDMLVNMLDYDASVGRSVLLLTNCMTFNASFLLLCVSCS